MSKITAYLKKNYLILLITFLSLYLRLDKLNYLMQFIPDQGWFYLSARDMLLTGNIPLVGPPTSHPWIHHGPLWTYMLAFLLVVSRFNPVGPAYYIAILGGVTVYLFYYVVSRMYSKRVGLIASVLFATSPLIVMNSRIPYHTSPIPFFVILLFFLTYLWIKGNVKMFPIITLLLGILYNHEITTFVFDIAIFLIVIFGIYKKKKWAKKLLNKKIIFYSLVLFLIPMIPFILYDIHNGYKQTFGFLVWVLYRILKFPLGLIDKKFSSDTATSSTIPEFFSYYKELFFPLNTFVSLGIFILSIGNIVYAFIKKKTTQTVLLCLFFFVSLLGLFMHRVPIEADTLLISPFFVLFFALFIDRFLAKKSRFGIIGVCALFCITILNVFTIMSTNYFTRPGFYFRMPYYEYMMATDKVIAMSGGKPYNIKGKGTLSDFPVFLTPYEYILWWKGNPPAKNKVNTTILIWEKNNNIWVLKIK